jgi:hypothetical protein
MEIEEINKITQSQIDQGLINHNDGSKQEGFEMGIRYMINQGQKLPISDVVVSSSNICTDTSEECKHRCSGLCKERC